MIEKANIFKTIESFAEAKVLCIGDIMMDRFVYGSVSRISPEAPIPVLSVSREKHMLGGAGNVVANIAALGAKSVILSAIADDAAGTDVVNLLDEIGADAQLSKFADRATIVKAVLFVDLSRCLELTVKKLTPYLKI